MPPLSGLRVVDLARLYPGPYATLILADLGADVVRVEEPGGDRLRHAPPLWPDGRGAYFEALHRGKRSAMLDIFSADGAEAVRSLSRWADVLVEGFRPGVLSRVGLGAAALMAANPRLVVCSISGFGQSGPDRDRAGHDLGYMARAGALGVAGEPHGPVEAWPGIQVADLAGGALGAVVQILAALRERDRTGRGRHLDVSMSDGALAFLQLHLPAAWSNGLPSGRGQGPLSGGLPCYGVYGTRDGRQVVLAALEPKFWTAFCAAVGRADLVGRGFEREARTEVEAVFAGRDLAEWEQLGRSADMCLEPVREGLEVTADPHFLARGMFIEAGGLPALRTATAIDPPPAAGAPAAGAHTREALEEAGADPGLIDRVAPRQAF